MQISHNVPALQTSTGLKVTGRELEKSIRNLSTSVKLNSAKDNPAGMAVVNKIKFQLSGLQTASKNAIDGISMVQTAEGALTEVHTMLERMKELAVYASTGSLGNDDRDKIQAEIDELRTEITSISERTEFNKIKLLNGQASRMAYSDDTGMTNSTLTRVEASKFAQVAYVSENVPAGALTYDITSAGEPAFVTLDVAALTRTVDSAGEPINGVFSINDVVVEVSENDTPNDRIQKLRDACDIAGLNFTFNDAGDKIFITTQQAGEEQKIKFYADADGTFNDLSLLDLHDKEDTGTNAKIDNAKYSNQSFDSSMTVTVTGNRVEFSANNGQKIVVDLQIELYTGNGEPTDTRVEGQFYYKDLQLDTVSGDYIATDIGTLKSIGVKVTDYGPVKLQIGPDYKMELEINIPTVTSDTLGLKYLNYKTQAGAMEALDIVDKAIDEVSVIRAKLGAYQNRLEHAQLSLDSTAENMEKSRSRLEDTDMATEMASYASLQVKEQAGIAILAQANQRPMEILSLLGK